MKALKQDPKHKYVFPNFMAKMMAKVDMRTQYEASMMSIVFILIGVILMAAYMIFFTTFGVFMKVMAGVNAVAGFIFLSSFLVTTYQQYISYMDTTDIELPDYGIGGDKDGQGKIVED